METSKAYYMSHILLRNKIFFESKEFNEYLSKGPQVMRQYLLDLWNSIDEKNFKEGAIIKDIDRAVSVDDFDISFRPSEEKNIFFFIMPDPVCYQAEAKAVALIISKTNEIRYITMEIWSNNEEENMKKILGESYIPQYTIGEWVLEENQFKHLNLGKIPRNTIECFASFIIEKLI